MRHRRYTMRDNLASAGVGIAIALIAFLILHPLYVKEQEHRKEIDREVIQEMEAADREYEAEVAAEKARWAAMEEDAEVITADYTVTELSEEDIAEEEYWDQLELLALVVEAEAGNQDLTGKRLVVDVILNRVDSPYFPDTIEGVITDEGQFSSYANGAVDEAGWHMQQSDYDAVIAEIYGDRLDEDIYFFTAGGYNPSGSDAYQHGDHFFSYLSKEVIDLESK